DRSQPGTVEVYADPIINFQHRSELQISLALDAVGVTVFLAGHLGAVVDEEAGVTGEFVLALWNDLDDEFLSDKFSAGDPDAVALICYVQLTDHASRVGRVG